MTTTLRAATTTYKKERNFDFDLTHPHKHTFSPSSSLLSFQLIRRREEMVKQYFDSMATIIQKRWRGYYSRKYKSDFYVRKQFLQALVAKNETVAQGLRLYEQHMLERQRQAAVERESVSEKTH
jgi:hypothetical protein